MYRKHLNIIIFLLLALLFATGYFSEAKADGLYVFGGFQAFDDTSTIPDYKGLSPLGSYGVKYIWNAGRRVHVSAGIKHQSSVGYREYGNGFNGPFVELNLKVF